ncbi:centriolar and ciliogenesis-associated protein HYLS1 [Onthophagus taurus]|uniref:centriolar and ciliogenesis-associated protein HYLS1 n=1 Tax=Onthophagus taurus TaxID=166361 RepID=UPI0039BEBB7A
MSIPIDSREVYEYLQELGYENISSKQLKEFVHDLKKLIKYEEKKKRNLCNKENVAQDIQETKQKGDIFQNLYETNTEASKAKIVQPKKDKIITVQVKKHKETCRHYKPKCEGVETQTVDVDKKDESPLSENKETQISQSSLNSKRSDKTTSMKESDQLVKIEDGKKSSSKENVIELKPKASFIRPKSVKTTKSDPVSLYHRYQAEWKKQKIPGVDNHSNLRWVIREKMLGDHQPSISRQVAVKKGFNKNSRV